VQREWLKKAYRWDFRDFNDSKQDECCSEAVRFKTERDNLYALHENILLNSFTTTTKSPNEDSAATPVIDSDPNTLEMENTRLIGPSNTEPLTVNGLPKCITKCQKSIFCVAVTYNEKKCFLFENRSEILYTQHSGWYSTVFVDYADVTDLDDEVFPLPGSSGELGILNHQRLIGIFTLHVARSYQLCVDECVRRGSCRAVTFDRRWQVCQLLGKEGYVAKSDQYWASFIKSPLVDLKSVSNNNTVFIKFKL
jgi:hypothetical protein